MDCLRWQFARQDANAHDNQPVLPFSNNDCYLILLRSAHAADLVRENVAEFFQKFCFLKNFEAGWGTPGLTKNGVVFVHVRIWNFGGRKEEGTNTCLVPTYRLRPRKTESVLAPAIIAHILGGYCFLQQS